MLRSTTNKAFNEVLVGRGLLSADDVARYTQEAQQSNQTLHAYLTGKNILSDGDILEAVAEHIGLEIVDLKKISVDKAVVEQVPVKFASFYKFMPLNIDDGVLTLAVSAPLALSVLDEIRVHLGLEPNMVLAYTQDIDDALKRWYGLASETIDHIMSKEALKGHAFVDDNLGIEDIEKQSNDPSVTKLVNQIILEAYHKRATDIHIEPYRSKVRFRYRIDGVLVDANLPHEARHFLLPILSRIKIMANISITEKRVPQDGSAVVQTKSQKLDLRVSTIPTPRGESMVIRILPTDTTLLNLERLGFDKNNAAKFRELVRRPHGVLFVTGPTGSGKTTTLYACLNEINSTARKIISIEDPIEYEMEGVTQIQVNSKLQFDFAAGLRSILRHDPDIIMVGEVRDLETAEIAIRTALTGHLVFSSLHTNDAASGVTRLIDMGLEPYLVASSVEAFIAQRLVRVICPHCKEVDSEPMEDIRREMAQALGNVDPDDITIYRGRGCDQCNQTGYRGRTAIYEILELTESIRSAILEKPRAEHIKQIALREGMTTLRQDGWKNVIAGVTTPMEVMNVTVKETQVSRVLDAVRRDRSKAFKSHEPIERAALKPKETAYLNPKKKLPSSLKKTPEGLPASAKKALYEFRAYPRVMEEVKVSYIVTQPDKEDPTILHTLDKESTGVTRDVSAGGLKFAAPEMISVGTILEFKIFLEADSEPIECLAKVCRIEEDNMSKSFLVSIYFMDITSLERTRLSHFVKSRMAMLVE